MRGGDSRDSSGAPDLQGSVLVNRKEGRMAGT